MTGSDMAAAARQRLALLALWAVPVLWTVNLIIARKAPGLVEPYTLAFGRWFIAALVLAVLSRRELWHQRAEVAAHWWQFLVLGFCGMMVCGAWVYLGAQTTDAMNISLIYSASPVLIGLGAVLWLGETLRWQQMLGVVLALAGVVHVVVQGRWTALAEVRWVAGDWWIVAAMVAWAAYALLQKLWPSRLGDTARLAAISWGGVLTLLPGALWEQTSAAHIPVRGEALAIMALAALGAWCGRVLDLRLDAEDSRCQSRGRHAIPWPPVCRDSGLLCAGRVIGLAPSGWCSAHFARSLARFSALTPVE